MSEFIAKARVLVTPDTTKFRATLEAELAKTLRRPLAVPVVAQVSSVGTAAKSATAALREQTAAVDALGAENTRTAVSTSRLASAQHSADVAARRLALSQEAVAGASSQVAAAQITLSRSVAAVAAAETAVERAVRVGNAELISATRNTLALAEAQEKLALTALTAARAEAAQARSLGAVNKAALASAASMTGLRGQVLTAGTAFLAATVGFEAARKSIQAASDTNEELNKTSVVFRESAPEIKAWAETTATSLGLAQVQALRAVGTFGGLFQTLGLGPERAAELSKTLVELSADLASFFNQDPGEALRSLRSGLAGEAEPLRKFNIFLTEARVQQEALIQTGKKTVESLTQQDKILARYNIILRDSAKASGDFARTQENLANQQRVLVAQLSDLSATLGELATGPLTIVIRQVNDLLAAELELIKAGKSLVSSLKDQATGFLSLVPGAERAGGAVGGLVKNYASLSLRMIALGPVLGGVSFAYGKLKKDTDEVTESTRGGFSAIAEYTAHLAAMQAVANQVDFSNILSQINALEVAQLKIQTGITPGGRGAEESNLRRQIAEDKRAVEAAKSGTAARRKALEELKADQDALAALQAQDAADAKRQADTLKQQQDARKSAAEAAARARQEADQVLLDDLGRRREDVQRRISAAAETPGVQDDIRRQNTLQALIKIQIQKIRDRIKDEKARKDAIRLLRIALIESRAEEAKLRQEQAAEQQAALAETINLDIQFAQTTNNVTREIAARQRLIALLKKQQSHVKKGTIEWKRLRNEIAEQQQAIKEARKQSEQGKEEGRTFAQAAFEFLQTQRGFAANLLGNLIPGFATAGLVGGTATAARRPGDVGPSPGERLDAAGALGTARDRGVRPVQVDTTNQLLRQILAALQGKHTTPPEAAHNRRVSNALLDTMK